MEIKNEIKNYIIEASLEDAKKIKDDTMIFDSGLLDSMGLLFLIEFLKEKFDVEVEDEELNPKNFESVNSITEFVKEKLKSKV
jgi:acyl carrier protein